MIIGYVYKNLCWWNIDQSSNNPSDLNFPINWVVSLSSDDLFVPVSKYHEFIKLLIKSDSFNTANSM